MYTCPCCNLDVYTKMQICEVKDVWNSLVKEGGGVWSPCFSRPFNDWEVDFIERFLLSSHRVRVCRDEEDRVH